MKFLEKVYHVTTVDNWNKIKQVGLIPQIGTLSQKIGENEDCIYAFSSLDELDNALINWLGQESDEMEENLEKPIDLAILSVDVRHLKIPVQFVDNQTFFEQKIYEKIDPSYIELIRIEESEFDL